MNNIIIKQISNPGISLTRDLNNKLISISEIVDLNNELELDYSDFQRKIISSGIFSGSYIRSFIPFLYNIGLINEYSKKINFKNFFTNLGKAYIVLIKTIKMVYDNNPNDYNLKNLELLKNDLIVKSLIHMIHTKNKYANKYCDILLFLKKFKTINREEFYIMQYCIENNLDLYQIINSYRKNSSEFSIKVLDNNNEIVDYKNNNAYNYFLAFLLSDQCNLLIKIDQSNCKLNEERTEIVDSILNEYEILRGE